MKMIELKATLEGGTRVAISALDKPIITLRKGSGDQREPSDSVIRFGVEEWAQVQEAVRELILMVGADGDRVPRPPTGSARDGGFLADEQG